jgi:hypothetical protein
MNVDNFGYLQTLTPMIKNDYTVVLIMMVAKSVKEMFVQVADILLHNTRVGNNSPPETVCFSVGREQNCR